MANMSKSLTTGKYELNITPGVSAQTKTIKVGSKYCDTDIDVKVAAIDAVLTINGSSPDSNGNALVCKTGSTTNETIPSALIESGNFLKLVKVR
jgi:hypothetical protein